MFGAFAIISQRLERDVNMEVVVVGDLGDTRGIKKESHDKNKTVAVLKEFKSLEIKLHK